MQCTVCSKQLKPNVVYCPACRAATPALGADFAERERRLSQLRVRRRAGIMNDVDYKAAVKELVVHDQAGNSWWLGGGHGGWYWHNGPSWEPRDPAPSVLGISPVALSDSTAQLPGPAVTPAARPAAADSPQPPAPIAQQSSSHYLLPGCLTLGVLLAIVAALFGIYLL